MAEAAEAHDADLLALADVPVAQRRVGGDAGAEQRRHGGEVELVRRCCRTKASSTTIVVE